MYHWNSQLRGEPAGSAIISRTQNVVYLKDGEIVHMTPGNFTITTLDSADV